MTEKNSHCATGTSSELGNKSNEKKAVLYRMVTDEHICPYGIKSKALLESEGFDVEDNHLSNREETDAFKEEHGVNATPQTFIKDKRVGGYDDLVRYFGKSTLKQEGTTYQPVIAIFATTFLMAIASGYAITGNFTFIKTSELFIAISMCVLGIMKSVSYTHLTLPTKRIV